MIRTKADSLVAFEIFLRRVKSGGSVWLLLDPDEDLPVVCSSNDVEGRFVVPVWSDKAFAKQGATHFPSSTEVIQVRLDRFLEYTLPFLHDQNEWLGPNWNADLAGMEIDPLSLIKQLT